MMFYMGELWDIDYYLPPGQAGKFENIRGDGVEMGCFKISKMILVPFKKGPIRKFLQQHQVWENNPLQPYQLVAPW